MSVSTFSLLCLNFFICFYGVLGFESILSEENSNVALENCCSTLSNAVWKLDDLFLSFGATLLKNNSSGYFLNDTNYFLVIQNASLKHDGNYHCVCGMKVCMTYKFIVTGKISQQSGNIFIT